MRTRVVYLLHFETAIGNPGFRHGQARHYIGSASDLEARQAEPFGVGWLAYWKVKDNARTLEQVK